MEKPIFPEKSPQITESKAFDATQIPQILEVRVDAYRSALTPLPRFHYSLLEYAYPGVITQESSL